MARVKGELKHGLQLGSETYTEFQLHDYLTAGMIIAAKEQAEKVVPFDEGGRVVPVVVESPARLGALMLCQQIASIGPLAGPLEYRQFATLHQEDLDILNAWADLLAGAIDARELSGHLTKLGLHASPEVTQRGRGDSAGAGAGGDGAGADAQGGEADRTTGTEE